MKNKIILSLSMLLLSVNLFGQIAIQSFENSGDTWLPLTFSTPPCTVGNDVWNTVSSLPGISPNDGSQFWGIRDLNGSCGGNGFETITLPNMSVSSFSNVIFSFDYNAIGFDNNEDLKYELFYDNISQGEVIVVNGVGGNSDNTNGWLTETVSIPSSVSNVSVILFAKCNNGNERAGFDNIRLFESSITNDNCGNALSLTVGSDNTQNVITGTNVGATSSGQLPNPSCANYQGNDIWYTTVVPANGIITVETLSAGSSIDTAIEIYTGNCNNLTQIACHDDKNWPLDSYSKIDLTGLAYATIYIRVWAWNNASSGDFNIVAYSPGCSSTTRWNNSRWNNGVPNSTTSVIINSDYDTAIDGSFESCDFEIKNNRTVNISANDYIIVNNDLTVNGVLEVRHEGSLLMKDDDAQISVNGTFRVHKTTTTLNDSDDYTFWSSPVEDINISSVFTASNYQQTRLYYWDQSVANIIPNGGSETMGEWIPAAGLTMQAGKGYISQSPTLPASSYPLKAKVNFMGKPNNGIITLSGNAAVYNAGNPNDDLNLVGNPYPSAIDADEFINQNNTDISGTLWFWTHNTVNNQNTSGEQYTANDYASYNLTGSVGTGYAAASGGVKPNKYIASGQGFMVQTLSTVTSIKFNNSMRIENNNNQFFRGTDTKEPTSLEKDRIWLNVESDKGGAFSQILIGFFENATDGVDQGYDGTKISEGWVNLYSKIDTLNYAIQGLSSFNSDKNVALSFQTYIEDNTMSYFISIDEVEGVLRDSDVFLVDNELNITHDLKQGNYNFTVAEAGNYPNRFTLQFTQTTLSTEDIKTNNDFSVINRENTINVKANTTIEYVKVYDITGRLLIDKIVNNSEIDIVTQSLKKGSILIINSIFEDNSALSKKIILTK